MVTKYGDQPVFHKIVHLTPNHREIIRGAVQQGLAKNEMSAIQLGIELLNGRIPKRDSTHAAGIA